MATDTRTNRFETKPCTMDHVGRYNGLAGQRTTMVIISP
jgi:hypothetical protein